jgi:hypothetical protein
VIDAPTVMDAQGATGPAAMSLAANGGGWTVTVSVNPSWLEASGRVFPVVIDPDVRRCQGVCVRGSTNQPE